MVLAHRRLFAIAFLFAIFIGGTIVSPWAAGHPGHDGAAGTPGASPVASPTGGHDATSSPGTGTASAFMTLTNTGADSDRLLGGATDVAGIIEIHDNRIDGGVMMMTPLIDGLEIPAGGSVAIEPQSFHLMLINLTRDLRPGDRFDLTLTFERAGNVVIPVTVGPKAPEDGAPVTVGEITVSAAWSRPAPMLSSGAGHGDPGATPDASLVAAPRS